VKWGDKYPADYVLRLRNMCRRNLPEHRFVCFTETPVPDVECRELPSDLPSWWSKIGLFKPGLFPGEDVLYLDLDVVITDRLHGMVLLLDQSRDRLWIRDDFSYSLRQSKRGLGPDMLRLLGGPGCCNSSVMLWHGDSCREVWDKFDRAAMDEMHGDQNWITHVLWPDKIALLPDEWASSYKYGGAGVIRVFHGSPKPHEVADRVVQECWR
jgi:hypothetical protein